MKYELLAINIPNKENDTKNVALIKRGNTRKEYAVVRDLDVHRSMEYDDCWGLTIGYYNDSIYGLQKAIECYRIKTEENYIPRFRLEELATKLKDYAEEVIESEIGHQEVVNYFRDELEMEDYELEFFGIETDESEV